MKNLPLITLIFLFFHPAAIAQTDIKMSELDCYTWGKPAEGTNYWTFLEQKGIKVGATTRDRNIRVLMPANDLVVFNDEICLRWIKLDKNVAYEFSITDGQDNSIYKISSLECGVRLRPRQFLDPEANSIRILMAQENEPFWGESYKITLMSNEEHERILKEIEKLPRLTQPQAAINLVDFYLSKGLIIDALTVLENRLAETPDEEVIINKYWEIIATSRANPRK